MWLSPYPEGQDDLAILVQKAPWATCRLKHGKHSAFCVQGALISVCRLAWTVLQPVQCGAGSSIPLSLT